MTRELDGSYRYVCIARLTGMCGCRVRWPVALDATVDILAARIRVHKSRGPGAERACSCRMPVCIAPHVCMQVVYRVGTVGSDHESMI